MQNDYTCWMGSIFIDANYHTEQQKIVTLTPRVEVLRRRTPYLQASPNNGLFPATVRVEVGGRISRMSQHRAFPTRVFERILLSWRCPVVYNGLDTHLASDERRKKAELHRISGRQLDLSTFIFVCCLSRFLSWTSIPSQSTYMAS